VVAEAKQAIQKILLQWYTYTLWLT
jgi:hypothetical protein